MKKKKKIFGLLKNFLVEFKKEIIAIKVLGIIGIIMAKYIIKHYPQKINLLLTITLPVSLMVIAFLIVGLWENIMPPLNILKKIKPVLKNILLSPISLAQLFSMAIRSITGKS